MSYAQSQGPKRTYEPVGRCIYCGVEGNSEETLGEEHIIPMSFGGNLILPRASCRSCEKVTTGFEDHCLKGLLSTARPHLGIRGRQRRNFDKKGPVYSVDGAFTRTHSVPIEEHPGALMIPQMPIPGCLIGVPLPPADARELPPAARLVIRPMTNDIAQRAWKINKAGLNLTKGQSALEFYRLIAKIAHSYTVAELGIDGFKPFLLNLIHLYSPMFADYFVGSGMLDEPEGESMHELGFTHSAIMRGGMAIVVRIRLFANLGMPTHFAVVGFKN